MNKLEKMFKLLSCIIILFVIFGCTDERRTKLERGVGFMRSLTNPGPVKGFMAGHYQANTPDGMIMLYHASLPADNSYPEAFSDRQSLQPWTILVLPGNKGNTLIIEGYGEDLTKPIMVEEISLRKRD